MPTNHPRLLVTISPHQRQLLGRLSALQGRPMSYYLSGLLDHAEAALEGLEEALLLARERDNPQIDLERFLSGLEAGASGATAPGAPSSNSSIVGSEG